MLQFTIFIGSGLTTVGTVQSTVGRPSKQIFDEATTEKRKYPTTMPVGYIQYDSIRDLLECGKKKYVQIVT